MKPTCWLNVGKVIVWSVTFGLLAGDLGRVSAAEKDRKEIDRGKELFTREWLPGDRRSHAGDGLGPMYNARSCAACHHLGGIGGAGAKHMNVTVVSVFLEEDEKPRVGLIEWLFGVKPKPPPQPDRAKLAKIHPALRTENSFPLHRFGTEKRFAKWQRELISGETNSDSEELNIDGIPIEPMFFGDMESANRAFASSRKIGNWTINFVPSERNAPALFGTGLIDRIPVRVLEKLPPRRRAPLK